MTDEPKEPVKTAEEIATEKAQAAASRADTHRITFSTAINPDKVHPEFGDSVDAVIAKMEEHGLHTLNKDQAAKLHEAFAGVTKENATVEDRLAATEALIKDWAKTAAKEAEQTGKVFGSIKNVGLGAKHVLTLAKNAEGKRGYGAGALGWAGVVAAGDAARRAALGTTNENGETERHYGTAAAEGAAALAMLAGALKIAEKNIGAIR